MLKSTTNRSIKTASGYVPFNARIRKERKIFIEPSTEDVQLIGIQR